MLRKSDSRGLTARCHVPSPGSSSTILVMQERKVPLSTLIVDDEQLARDELAYLLKNIGDVEVVAQGKNGLEAVTLIREHNPDLVFLDVQMPGLDGFGVIKKLLNKKVTLPKIVFSTAFDQYAAENARQCPRCGSLE